MDDSVLCANEGEFTVVKNKCTSFNNELYYGVSVVLLKHNVLNMHMDDTVVTITWYGKMVSMLCANKGEFTNRRVVR